MDFEQRPIPEDLGADTVLKLHDLYNLIIDAAAFSGTTIIEAIMEFGAQFALTGAIGVTFFTASHIYGSTLTAGLRGFIAARFNDNDAAYHDTAVDVISMICSYGLLSAFVWIVDRVALTNARFAGYPRISIALLSVFQMRALRMMRSPYEDMLWNTCMRESTTLYCSAANAAYWYCVRVGVAIYVLTYGYGVFYTR